MNLATMLPVLQRNEVVDLSSAILAQAPYSAWNRMSGVSVADGKIKVIGLNRELVNAIGDDDSPPEDDPIAAPAVNNDVALTVTGDFQITAVLSIPMDQDLHMLLYGVVPMVQDEWQNDNNMLDIEINVWDESDNTSDTTATIWWTSYNKTSGTKEGEKDFYSGATAGDKQDALYNLCSSLLTAGVPLHGVGFQMHEDMNDPDFQSDTPDQGSVSPAELRTAIQRFKTLGLQVRVSEMDVNLHSIGPNTVQAQGDYFRDMMEVCIEEQARSFTMWGFTDKWTSLQEWTEYYQYGNGVIFDTNYTPKIAYTEMLARLKQAPA